MNHRIQIIVDDKLNDSIRAGAAHMGLSVSSFARLALMSGLKKQHNSLLDQALDDLEKGEVEPLSLKDIK